MSSTPIRKRKVLTLADRVNVIKRREKGEKAEVIAKSLEVGVTQHTHIIFSQTRYQVLRADRREGSC